MMLSPWILMLLGLVTCLSGLQATQNDDIAALAFGGLATSSTPRPTDMIDMEVLGFRLWMIIGLVCLGLLVIVIVLCCVFDCRIPRTKQEIDANYERRQLKRQLSKQMKRVPPGHQVKVVRGRPGVPTSMPASLYPGGAPDDRVSQTYYRSQTSTPSSQPGSRASPVTGMGMTSQGSPGMGMTSRGSPGTDGLCLASIHMGMERSELGRDSCLPMVMMNQSDITVEQRQRPLSSTQMRPHQKATARTLSSMPPRANTQV